MNILITSFSFPNFKDGTYDGKFVLSEALAYAENGANVRVLTPHYDRADKVESMHERIRIFRFQYFIPKSFQVLKKPGVPIYNQRSPLQIFQIPFLCFFFVLSILKHAAWADIIHAQWTATALMTLPAKWIFGKKVVVTARGSDLRLLPHWLNRFIHNRVDAAIDCFGPQPWNVAYKERFPTNFITLPQVVHNHASELMPEDMKEVFCYKPNAFVILYVGRYDRIKIDNKFPLFTLIHASKILKSKNRNFQVFYIGAGEERIREEMVHIIDQNDLKDCVKLLGPKTNVLDYIHFCHLGAGGVAFNGVSQEFTISGKPQILVEFEYNAGTPWHHGVNAIFVKPDDPADLGEKLIWAMENREELEKIGQRAKNEMSTYIVGSRAGGELYLKKFQNLINSYGFMG